MPATQEQQKHYAFEASWWKHSTRRKSTSGFTRALRVGKAWQHGLDHQRKRNTSSYIPWLSTTSCESSRSTRCRPRPPSSPSTLQQRRTRGISLRLGSTPNHTNNTNSKHSSFTKLASNKQTTASTNIACLYNTTCAHLHIHLLSHGPSSNFNMEYVNMILSMFTFLVHIPAQHVGQHDWRRLWTWLS